MLQLFKYHLPFKKALQTSAHSFAFREGIIISYTEDQITAYGEASPLPFFSTDSLKEVETVLQINRAHIEENLKNRSKSLPATLNSIHKLPSLAFALDTLTHDLQAKRSGVPFFNTLAPGKAGSVNSNALISIHTTEQVINETKLLKSKGFSVFKFKLGRDFSIELRCLEEIRKTHPDIIIRIDTNGSWAVDEAIRNLNALQHLRIEYCEQPVSKKDLIEFAKVKKETEVIIAADESVRNKMDAIELIKAEAVDVLIIKPSLFGEFKNISVTKELADSHNIDIVFSTALESAVARAGIANLAAAFGSNDKSHGLGTGFLFNYDLADCAWLNTSNVNLPDTVGLGIIPDVVNLKEI